MYKKVKKYSFHIHNLGTRHKWLPSCPCHLTPSTDNRKLGEPQSLSEFLKNVLEYRVHQGVHCDDSCPSTISNLLCNPFPKQTAALHFTTKCSPLPMEMSAKSAGFKKLWPSCLNLNAVIKNTWGCCKHVFASITPGTVYQPQFK
jgi:hypothetical protein